MTPSTPTSMPQPIKHVYDPLRQEVVNLHFLWKDFVQAFGTTEATIVLLNRFAPVFFGTVQRVLADEIVLSIFRLLDPAVQARKDNLSLERLVNVVMTDNATLGAALDTKRAAANSVMQPYESRRNKVIAHNDLSTSQAQFLGNGTLAGPSRSEVIKVLGTIASMMNDVSGHYDNATTHYDTSDFPDPGDANTLIHHLELLERHMQLVRDAEMRRRTGGES